VTNKSKLDAQLELFILIMYVLNLADLLCEEYFLGVAQVEIDHMFFRKIRM
jgi:hypothetical protein